MRGDARAIKIANGKLIPSCERMKVEISNHKFPGSIPFNLQVSRHKDAPLDLDYDSETETDAEPEPEPETKRTKTVTPV